MNPAWISIADQPPEGEEWILLFHPVMHSDPAFQGISVVVFTSEYARSGRALVKGYSHWAPIPYPMPAGATIPAILE